MNPYIRSVWNIPRQKSDIVDNYFKTIISYSHIMGSVTSLLVDYIRSAYSDDYFATIWNTLEVPYSQRSKAFRDIMSKPRPTMIIDPRFDPSDEARFVPQSEFDSWIANDPMDAYKINSLDSALLVGYKNFGLFYKPRRYKMTFNIHFSFDSDVQRIQCQEYMRQSIRHKSPIIGHRYIENILPDDYMIMIAELNGFDYRSDKYLDFLNEFTTTPITRRIRTGSGNIEFFALQKTPIEMMFIEGPSSNGPITKGNITVSSSFSEEVTVEFVAYSLLYLKTSVHKGEPIYKTKPVKPESDDAEIQETGDVINVASEKFNVVDLPRPPFLDDGCVKLQQVTLQADKAGDDTVNLFEIMRNPEIVEMLNYYRTNHLKMDFIHVLVYEEINLLNEVRYKLDATNLNLTITDMDVYKPYYVVIYLDKTKMGDIKQPIFETDKINRIR